MSPTDFLVSSVAFAVASLVVAGIWMMARAVDQRFSAAVFQDRMRLDIQP